MSCAPAWLQCGGDSWNGAACCEDAECHEKDEHYSQCIPKDSQMVAAWESQPASAAPQYCQHIECSFAGGTDWTRALQSALVVLEEKAPWSQEVSVGVLQVTHWSEPRLLVQAIRNPGGGTSDCCSMHPVAAAARAYGTALQVRLEPRTTAEIDQWSSRNGARVYLAALTPRPSDYDRIPPRIPDPAMPRPPDWDDEDDGEWEAPVVANPAYRGLTWDGRASTIDEVEYVAWSLLGRTLAFTIDLSQAACGCNAAVYLVSMAQNHEPGNCGGDRYCDANAVCGVRCAEIDLLEANRLAFHLTAHTPDDGDGSGTGLGGSFGTDLITPSNYGPGSDVIDTLKPIRVSAYFATASGPGGGLRAIEITLRGDSGTELRMNMTNERYARKLHDAVAAGMTPTVSYWSDAHLGWLQDGVCKGWADVQEAVNKQQDECGEHITVSHFEVHDGRHAPPPPPPQRPPHIPPSPLMPPPPQRPPPPAFPPSPPWDFRFKYALKLGGASSQPPGPPPRPGPSSLTDGSHAGMLLWLILLIAIGVGVAIRVIVLASRSSDFKLWLRRHALRLAVRQSLHSFGGLSAEPVLPRPRSKKGAVKVAVDEESAELEEAKMEAASERAKTYSGASNHQSQEGHEEEAEEEEEEAASQSGKQAKESSASEGQDRSKGFDVSRIAISVPMTVAGMD